MARSSGRQSGFSLVEVMVGLGLVSVMAIGMTQLMTNSFKSQRSVGLGGEIDDMKNLLRLTLDNEQHCHDLLVGMGNDVPDLGGAQPVKLKDFIAPGKNLKENSVYGSLTITNLQLTRDNTANQLITDSTGTQVNSAVVMLQYTATKPSGSVGNLSSTAKIPLRVNFPTAGAPKISSCSASPDSDLSASAMCSSIGGTYQATHVPPCYLTTLTLSDPTHPAHAITLDSTNGVITTQHIAITASPIVFAGDLTVNGTILSPHIHSSNEVIGTTITGGTVSSAGNMWVSQDLAVAGKIGQVPVPGAPPGLAPSLCLQNGCRSAWVP